MLKSQCLKVSGIVFVQTGESDPSNLLLIPSVTLSKSPLTFVCVLSLGKWDSKASCLLKQLSEYINISSVPGDPFLKMGFMV